jgi:hypothetical protein
MGEPMTKATKMDVLLEQAAAVAVRDMLAVRKGERVTIITNPEPDVETISQALYRQACPSPTRSWERTGRRWPTR